MRAGDSLVGGVALDKKAKGVVSVPLVCEAPPAAGEKADKEAAEGSEAAAGGEAGGGNAGADGKQTSAADAEAKAAAADDEALAKALLEARLGRLRELRGSGASAARYAKLSDQLYAEHREHLPLLLERLAWARAAPRAEGEGEEAAAARRAADVSAAADALLAPEGPVDTAKLAQYFGVARDDDADAAAAEEAKEEKEAMSEQRKALRLALLAKAAALAPRPSSDGAVELVVAGAAADAPPSPPAPFVEAVRALKQWVSRPEDVDEAERDELALTLAMFDVGLGKPAAALATLLARTKAQPSAKRVARRAAALCRALGWEHWERNHEERLAAKWPAAKPPL